MKDLSQKNLTRFVICIFCLLMLATPMFYYITKSYYADEMLEMRTVINESRKFVNEDPQLKKAMVNFDKNDFIENIATGMVIQYILIAGILFIALIIMQGIISKRLWKPFYSTLERVKQFSLEKENIPQFEKSSTGEFMQLNATFTQLMTNNLRSYKTQKEFTENASHELRTPLAVFQGKLDLLLQQPLSEAQADIVKSLYEGIARLAKLNKNLLLLAKIDNQQYTVLDNVDITKTLQEHLAIFESLSQSTTIQTNISTDPIIIKANKTLLECMIDNLIVNALLHNKQGGIIEIGLNNESFEVSNQSDEGALNKELLFRRFYHSPEKSKGNGLGLAIVKAICNYHNWIIDYYYQDQKHHFKVSFIH
ncbi:MAG: HAMP domain-containing histidine kinase [Bacteroidaceae bacterium]|nr:HAMP domain-containing histidine kinase [Bacteroidaceae bacterium]